MDDIKKTQRAEIFAAALDAAGVPEWGRGASIVKATGCSPASAQAWIRGSLPSDGERIIQLCDLYNIDLYLWVDLKSREKADTTNVLLEAIVYVKDFEEQSNFTLTPAQFAHLCGAYLDENKRANIEEIVSILKVS
jgi:hypothetical protein